ncbi:hypothetical protein JCM3765_005224 [Sporobolomyces pararoseus]
MSSTSSKSDSGECVVCGKESVTRCSACAKNGTPWMYFCGREHQKLIWTTHKRVCGVNSNPFRWPRMTKAEWSEAQENFRWAFDIVRKDEEDWGKLNKTEFMKQFIRIRGLHPYSAFMLEDEEVPREMKPYEQSGLAAAIRNVVSYIRESRKAYNRESGKEWTMTDISADPWGQVSRTIGYHDYHRRPTNREPPSWCHFLGHRVLIHYTVLGTYYKDFSAFPTLEPTLRYTQQKTLQCAEETVASIMPHVSENIHITLLQEFSPDDFRYIYEPV